MNEAPTLTPRDVVRLVWRQRWIWIGSTVVCGALAVAYALVAPRYWEASQALVVRQETGTTANSQPGKFADLYEMKTLQETILELARSRQVVVDTVTTVDRQLTGVEPAAPTDQQIEKFRKRMKMEPPGGAEFGKTEVFYFCVQDVNRQRAIMLVGELCRQLDAGLKQLRAERAVGLIAELEEERETAGKTNAQETLRLAAFESKVGADLGELRMLQSGASGQSDLRQEAVQLGREARQYQQQLRESQQLLALLESALDDPQQLIATPNTLLTSQPALRRLKDGLLDAQINTAKLIGARSADHPRVLAAVDAEAQIRGDIHRELTSAIRAAQIDIDLGQQRYRSARARVAEIDDRLTQLADMRAEYSNRIAALENSRLSLDRARQNLSAARASEAAAHSGSLVTLIDKPETGPYPAGVGRTVIAGAGAIGGFILGLGWLFLTMVPTPPDEPESGNTSATAARREPADRESVPREPAPREPTPRPAEKIAEPAEPFPHFAVAEHADRHDHSDQWWMAVAAETAAAIPSAVVPQTAAASPRTLEVVGSAPLSPEDFNAEWPLEDLPVSFDARPAAGFGTLPRTPGVLPPLAGAAAFAGMSLEEAIAGAERPVH